MKQKYLKRLCIVWGLGFVFLFTHCAESDDIPSSESPKEQPAESAVQVGSNIKHVSSEDVPEIISVVSDYSGKPVVSGKGLSYKRTYIDLNNILEVVNKENKTNFTFGVYLENQPEDEFYNLIVHKTPEGIVKKPYIRRYKVFPHAMDEYRANNYDFRYFQGTFQTYSFEEFFSTMENSKEQIAFRDPDCDGGGGTIGGGAGTVSNPDLIDLNNSVTWGDSGYFGYTRPQGPWNNYGGTGGYDLEVQVHNVAEDRNEVAAVEGMTYGLMNVNANSSITTADLSTATIYMNITSYIPSEGSSSPCSITFSVGVDGSYSTYTRYFNCGGPPMQQKGTSSNRSEGCDENEEDGEVGVVDAKTLFVLRYYLELSETPGEEGYEEYTWLESHPQEANAIADFLKENGNSEESIAFAKEIVKAGAEETLVTMFPLIKYPKGSDYATRYPKLTEYLKNQLPKVADIPKITNAIRDITGLSLEQIKKDLQWGQGPTIQIVQLNDYPSGTAESVGRFEKETPDRILLDIDFVEKLENTITIQEEEDAFLFFLGTTILHEYVHLGDFNNGDNYKYPLTEEEGRLFEVIVYGQNVQDYNAIEILNKN